MTVRQLCGDCAVTVRRLGCLLCSARARPVFADVQVALCPSKKISKKIGCELSSVGEAGSDNDGRERGGVQASGAQDFESKRVQER